MINKQKNVGIVGAGAIAHGLVAFLESNSATKATLWSPSGRKLTEKITVEGAINTDLNISIAHSAKELAENNDIIIFALPVNGHKSTMQKIAPHLHKEHHIIISSYASFSALFLEKLLLDRNLSIPITAWNTTAITAKMFVHDKLTINVIRKKIDISTIPLNRSSEALELCKQTFNNEFIEKNSLLEIILSNLNPEVHMGMTLCNITRMEQAEEWCQRKNVTPAVGRLIKSLDKERLAIAKAFGCEVKSIHDAYGLDDKTDISSFNQALHSKKPVWGPKTAESRYVLEDVPYGLVVIIKLGDYIGQPATIHQSGINLFSSLYGIDFSEANELLNVINIQALTPKEIRR